MPGFERDSDFFEDSTGRRHFFPASPWRMCGDDSMSEADEDAADFVNFHSELRKSIFQEIKRNMTEGTDHVPSPSKVEANAPCWIWAFEAWRAAFFQQWIMTSGRTYAMTIFRSGRVWESTATDVSFSSQIPTEKPEEYR